MTSQRILQRDRSMYGGRSSRQVGGREGFTSMTPRKSVYSGSSDNHGRVSRGKASVDEDIRLGSSRGGDVRATGFSGGGGKSRGHREHVDHHRSEDISPYATITERRGYRDESMVKMIRGADEASLRTEGVGRRPDGSCSGGDRVVRPVTYPDDLKWVRNGNYDTHDYDGGAASLRDMDYLPAAKTATSVRPVLPGFIIECPRRSILGFFSQKGSFVLPFEDRRLAEQVGPTTKIFMFDGIERELHGVFQAESYPTVDVDNALRVSQGTPVRVRVRVAKECIPLTERHFKEILHENYYTHSKFAEFLTKEQVMKLLQTFRSVDPARRPLVILPTSRRTADSGLPHGSQEFHTTSDEIVYRKEERWRRDTVDTRLLSGHSYHSQEGTRFSSKLPAPIMPGKVLDDFEDYGDDEGIEDLPVGSSRLITSSVPNSSTSRVKQHSLRSLSGSRTAVGHLVGSVGNSELKLAEANWGEDMNPRDVLYRKRNQLSPSPLDESNRGVRSTSPLWKDLHPRVEGVVGELYDRPGKVIYKDASSYMSSRRRRHNDIDLNMPLEIKQGEPAHLLELEPRSVRMVWDNEEEKGYSLSPPTGRSFLRGSSSLQISDHLSVPIDDYNDSKLDSRHMVSVSRKDYPLLKTEDKSRHVLNSFSNGKSGKPHLRAVLSAKNYPKEKPVGNQTVRNLVVPGRDSYSKDPTSRVNKAPVFQIKANLQAPGRGKIDRVVTMVDERVGDERVVTILNTEESGSWEHEEFGDGVSNNGLVRKRKASVWSRITLPGKVLGQKGPVTYGRGRVFSRLGPSTNPLHERRDDPHGHKNKKPRLQLTEIDIEDDSERFDDIENSPDALEGEDYLNDDPDPLEGSDKYTEKAANDIHGWTRKKVTLINSGDESGLNDHGECANTKGGRRKLVRPAIGTKSQGDNNGWKHLEPTPGGRGGDNHAQLRSRSGLMGIETAHMEALETTDDSPQGSHQDFNALAENYHPDFEEDNMMP